MGSVALTLTGMKQRLAGSVLVLTPAGEPAEADFAGIDALSVGHKGVVLDLSEVPYLSSQGVVALLGLQARLKCPFVLAAPAPLVKRILHQAGIASVLPLHASVEAALASLP